MAFQPESPTYDGGVIQLETSTPVQGGVGGASNAPILSLANRTAYLKQHVDALEAAAAGNAPLNSPAFTGTPTAPDVTAGDSSGKLANTKFVQNATGGILTKNVAGSANVTLTAAEAGVAIIILVGALTGNINIIVPNASDEWIFFNNTTGNFTVTVKTAAGSGILVSQAQSYFLYCDGADVRAAGAANQSSFQVQKFTATAGQVNFSVLYTPGNLIVFKNGAYMAPVDDYVATSGNDIGMSVACTAGDEIVTYAFTSFTSSGAVSKAGDTMLGALGLAAGSTAPTPPQFDNDTSLATTAFVRQHLGMMRGETGVGGAATLDASHIGTEVYMGGAGGYAVTLPSLASSPAGSTLYLVCATTGGVTVQRGGADLIGLGNGTTTTSLALGLGDTVLLMSNGASWFAIGGTAQLKYSSSFGASIGGATGYQKLPSGLIIQWGQGGPVGVENYTFPIAFPNACLQIVATAKTTTTSVNAVATIVNTSTFQLASSTGGTTIAWIAVGY